MGHIKKPLVYLAVFLLAILNTKIGFAVTGDYFFKNPSCDLMQREISTAPSDPKIQDAAVVWTTMVFNKIPDCIDIVKNNFSSYSKNAKGIYLSALNNVGRKDLAKSLSERYQVAISKINNLSVSDIQNLDVTNNTKNMDLAWAAFDATGDLRYPKKLTTYVAAQDKFSQQIAAELVNRRMISDFAKRNHLKGAMGIDDLINATQKRYGISKEEALNKLLPIAAADYSLWLNKQRDPALNQQLKE
jgi:hypothetical protein